MSTNAVTGLNLWLCRLLAHTSRYLPFPLGLGKPEGALLVGQHIAQLHPHPADGQVGPALE